MSILIYIRDDYVTDAAFSDLGHSADPQEIEDLEKFLQQVIPAEGEVSAGL